MTTAYRHEVLIYKILVLAFVLALIFSGCAPNQLPAVASQRDSEHHQVFSPDDIEWQPAPPSFEPGAEIAILEGDPSLAGELYTIRLKMPPNYMIAPHTHPLPERAVVLSGEFYLGHGEAADREAAERLQIGTYFNIPPGMVHYVMTGSAGETLLHITSIGPLELNYVNPEDDPRLR